LAEERRWREAITHHERKLLQLGDTDALAAVEERNEKNAALAAGYSTLVYQDQMRRQRSGHSGVKELSTPEEEQAYREAAAKKERRPSSRRRSVAGNAVEGARQLVARGTGARLSHGGARC